MNLKNLFLGVACVFAAGSSQAADLPAEPASVDYVRVCDAFGSVFYIPGTDSCLRLRGRLRTEIRYRHQDEDQPVQMVASAGTRGDSPVFMRARGYWGWDHRTNTDIGMVRAFFRGYVDRDTRDGNATSLHLDYAFIQIGGLTAGFADSILEPVFQSFTLDHTFDTVGYDDETLIAQYEYSFGNGFSIGGVVADPTVGSFGSFLRTTGTAFAGLPFTPVAYGGLRLPSVGGALSYNGPSGSLRLAGLIQDVRRATPAAAAAAGAIGSNDHSIGWALGFSGTAGIPLGTKTKIGFNVQVTEGILQFLHEDTSFLPVGDFTANAAGTATKLSKGWSASMGFSTQVFDRTTFNVTGGYTDIRQNFGVIDVKWYDLHANLQYRLTDNLVVTAEGQYRELKTSALANSDAFSTVLRAQLDF